MTRNIMFDQGIVRGEVKREISKIFPETESNFRQRKNYDEYYFDSLNIRLTIEKISKLNESGFSVSINFQDIIILTN